jgi:hypothetical protein
VRDLHLLEEPGAVFPWIAIWGAVQRTGKGADHRTEQISIIFMFEIFFLFGGMAGSATFKTTTYL